MDEIFATGLTTDNDAPTNIEELETTFSTATDGKIQAVMPRNRAERRALAKKLGKRGRAQYGDQVNAISETAKKLDYINLIQQLRQLNEKKENENEAIEG